MNSRYYAGIICILIYTGLAIVSGQAQTTSGNKSLNDYDILFGYSNSIITKIDVITDYETTDQFINCLDVSPYRFDIDFQNQKVYFGAFNGLIQRANLDGSNLETLVSEEVVYVSGIRVDNINNKLYWSDFTRGKIFRSNLDGSEKEVFKEGVFGVRDVDVDPINNHVYWLRSNDIVRANLDGSAEVSIFANVEYSFQPVYSAYRFRVDVSNNKVYWATTNNDIRRANLDGTGYEYVVDFVNYSAYGLDIVPETSKLYFCEDDNRVRKVNTFPPFNTTVLTSQTDILSDIKADRDHVYYSLVNGKSINKMDTSGQDLGVSLQPNWYSIPVGACSDLRNGDVYWTDSRNKSIHRNAQDGTGRKTIISNLNAPKGITIDTINNKIFWIDGATINRANLDGSNSEILLAEGLNVPTKVQIDEVNQILFWCDNYGIGKCSTTGENSTRIYNASVRAIALDQVNSRIHFIRNGQTGAIYSIDVNGNNQQSVNTSGSAKDLILLPETNTLVYINEADDEIRTARTDGVAGGEVLVDRLFITDYRNSFLSFIPKRTSSPTGDCANITDIPNEAEIEDAVSCLCSSGYITPHNYANENTNGVQPEAPIYRADLAKLVYYTLFKNGNTDGNPAINYPTPFQDLEEEFTNPYYDYGKILSYLTYQDGIPPFNRDFANFLPYGTIEKRYALKVILEALDISPDESGPSPFPAEIMPGEDGYAYVKKAYDLELIDEGDVKLPVSRGEIFKIIYRYIQQRGNGSCDLNYTVPTPLIQDYFVPGNLLSNSLSRSIGISEGFFTHAEKPSFSIPGINLTLKFQHFYSAFLTDAPVSWRKLQPLGIGWSHTYNAYITEEKSFSPEGLESDKLYVVWPGKQIDRYDKMTLTGESIGVFDELIPSGANYVLRKKNQLEYDFTKYYIENDSEQLDSLWMMTAVRDRNNNTITINVEQIDNGRPRVASVTGTTGLRQLFFSYQEGTDYLSEVQDIAGSRVINFQVNSQGDLQHYVNPRRDTTTYDYGNTTQAHLLQSVKLPRGNVITAAYNSNRKLQALQLPDMPAPVSIDVNENFGTGDYTSSISMPTSNITVQSVFNNMGQVLQRTNNETIARLDYHPTLHLPTTLTFGKKDVPSEQVSTSVHYDAKGNITKVSRPMGIVDSFAYNSLNDLIHHIDPRGYISRLFYDANNNLDYVEDKMGFVTDLTINNQGQLLRTEGPENIALTFEYDVYGNRIRTEAPLGQYQQVQYDILGRPQEVRLPESRITKYSYDLHDQVTQVIRRGETEDIITNYRYDKNDNLTEVENALGHVTTMIYNDRDLVEKVGFGDDTTRYEYRADNLLNNYIKPDGTLMNIAYDVQGRVITDGYSQYSYDARNNVKTIRHLGQTTVDSFSYDALDRIDDYTDIYGKLVDYEYDVNSNITQIIYPGGFTVNYEYDPNNRLEFVRWNNGSQVVQYLYLQDGRIQRINYPNGTYTLYEYDAGGRMIALTNLKSTAVDTICSYTYTLDSLGNHLAEIGKAPLEISELPEADYTGTFNEENELVSYQGAGYSFDANGNQTSVNTTTSTWDEADQMTSYGDHQYTYDGMGRLRRASRAETATRYVWDVSGMGNILMETDDNGNPNYYYIHGLGLAARVNAATDATHYYHYDFRGSTIAMTDESENITHSYKYLPFGELWQEQETDTNAFKYVGRWGVVSEGEGLYYMRARFYDSNTGRFLSEDPVWHENLYAYSDNNPIRLTDPTGMDADSDIAYLENHKFIMAQTDDEWSHLQIEIDLMKSHIVRIYELEEKYDNGKINYSELKELRERSQNFRSSLERFNSNFEGDDLEGYYSISSFERFTPAFRNYNSPTKYYMRTRGGDFIGLAIDFITYKSTGSPPFYMFLPDEEFLYDPNNPSLKL